MAFYKNPIIEEDPRCIVCGVVVYDGSIVCSVTCEQLQTQTARRAEPEMDWENLAEFIAQQHEPSYLV